MITVNISTGKYSQLRSYMVKLVKKVSYNRIITTLSQPQNLPSN